MKHIFLTGEIQIGKSTVIKKTLSIVKVKHGGFRTYFGADRSDPNRRLYINKAEHPLIYDGENVVAVFSNKSPPEVFSERFDTLGVRFIEECAEYSRLIIMDELGNLENQASLFQGAVLGALEGSIQILGVVKRSATGWVDEIRNHPSVALITVDKQNRDALPEFLADSLQYSRGCARGVKKPNP